MKEKLAKLLTVAGVLMTAPVFAEGSYPVLRPGNCQKNIVIPEGANAQFYLSKDCRTVFVLPRDASVMKVSALSLGASVTDSDCARSSDIDARLKVIEVQVAKLDTEVEKLTMKLTDSNGDVRISDALTKVTALADKYRKLYTDLESKLPYSNWEGANINIHLALELGKDVNAFQTSNPDKDLVFRAVPISSGIISFRSNDKADLRSIIESSFPGIGGTGKDIFEPSNHVIANGGLSGAITLAQTKVCSMIRKLQKKAGMTEGFHAHLLDTSNVEVAGLAVNYIYEVPVSTELSFMFEAKVAAENLQAGFKGSVIKGETTQQQISELLYDGGIKSEMKVTYSDGGQPFAIMNEQIKDDKRLNPDNGHIFHFLFGNAMDLYLEAVIEKMKSMKLLQEKVSSDIHAVDGKEHFTDRAVMDCRWKTRWGRTKRKCSTHIVKDREFIPGISTVDNTGVDNSVVELKWEVIGEQTLVLKHTTGFVQTAHTGVK